MVKKPGKHQRSKQTKIYGGRSLTLHIFCFMLIDYDMYEYELSVCFDLLCRRPLAVRERFIYSMTPERIDAHSFNLFLKTQAGTYPTSIFTI